MSDLKLKWLPEVDGRIAAMMKAPRAFGSLGLIPAVLIGLAVLSGLAYYLITRTNPPTPLPPVIVHPNNQPPSTSETALVSATPAGSNTSINTEFANPEPVVIQGYRGNAEEPYLTPDGQYLVFDSRTGLAANEHPKIYYAKRINDTTFAFLGEVKGVNTGSVAIMASIDDDNNFYFISQIGSDVRNLAYTGKWHDGTVANVAPVPNLYNHQLGVPEGVVNVSPDGNTLYIFTVGNPQNTHIAIALRKSDGTFTKLEDGSSDPRMLKFEEEFKNIYGMYYGGPHGIHFSGPMMMTRDGLEAFFEQMNIKTGGFPPHLNRIYTAKRTTTSEPFGAPQLVGAQTPGFNEGAFISRDGNHLYYHHLDLTTGHFSIYAMTRR